MAQHKEKRRSEFIGVRVTRRERQLLFLVAEKTNKSVSWVVRSLLRKYYSEILDALDENEMLALREENERFEAESAKLAAQEAH